jgi:hypothetical protein
MGTIYKTEYWVIQGFFLASWLTPVLAIINGITVLLYRLFGADFINQLSIFTFALTIWGQYLSVGILGISILFGIGRTLRTTILSIIGIWFIATIYSWGMPSFAQFDMQVILYIISLSTIFTYQAWKHKRRDVKN